VSSITWTKPGASPFGEASHRPNRSVGAMTRNGEQAMNSRECLSNRLICFFSDRSVGAP
jgi:hypothetical protein